MSRTLILCCVFFLGCEFGENDGHWDVKERFTTEEATHPANMDTQPRYRQEILAFTSKNSKQCRKDKEKWGLSELTIRELDIDKYPTYVAKWQVTDVPTYIATSDGKELFRTCDFDRFIVVK